MHTHYFACPNMVKVAWRYLNNHEGMILALEGDEWCDKKLIQNYEDEGEGQHAGAREECTKSMKRPKREATTEINIFHENRYYATKL